MSTEAPAAPAPTPTPTPAPTPAPSPAPDWFDTLPKELQDAKTVQKFKGKGVADAMNALVHAERMIGSDKILKPQDDWSDADWQKFYDAKGRPADINGYEIPKTLPDGVQIDPTEAKNFFAFARNELGLNKREAAKLLSFHAEMVARQGQASAQAEAAAMEAAKAELQQTFGAAYEERMKMARDGALQFAASDDDRKAILSDPAIANNPALIRFFANVAKAVADDAIIGRGSGFKSTPTPDEARAEMSRLRSDPDFMRNYNGVGTAPETIAAREKMAKLYDATTPKR